MSRKLRLFVTDMPYHVIQRGNNKNPIFFSDSDRLCFLNMLLEAKNKHPCFIYGYCLMSNHFHLLIQPKEKDNISLFMKLLGAKYVHYVNKTHNRTGTLWEGRFKCSLIDGETYFLTCLHYIEMNPVRSEIANSPELYYWSSHRFRAFGAESRILDFDSWYDGLGFDKQTRQFNYRQLFQFSTLGQSYEFIREMTNKGGIVGTDSFKERIERILHREIIFREPGRPKNQDK